MYVVNVLSWTLVLVYHKDVKQMWPSKYSLPVMNSFVYVRVSVSQAYPCSLQSSTVGIFVRIFTDLSTSLNSLYLVTLIFLSMFLLLRVLLVFVVVVVIFLSVLVQVGAQVEVKQPDGSVSTASLVKVTDNSTYTVGE